jgi:cobalt/nickel transport system permease protein
MLSGKSELPFGTFLLMMQPIHLAIGLVEGIVTTGVITYVRHTRPEILESMPEAQPLAAGTSLKKVFMAFVILAVITGGALSWFASTYPDGLEWSIERVYGKAELPEQEHGAAEILKGFQEKTAFLPDYAFKQTESEPKMEEAAPSWPGVDMGTSLSGILGAAIVLGIIMIVGVGIRAIRESKS